MALSVVQFRDYRRHQIELLDHGKAGCSVIIHPPRSMGAPREVTRDSTTVTLSDLVHRAKAEIDAVMGPKPLPRMGFNRRPSY
ncbi:hypothetical protein [Roseomonas sp. BN140053]|uniref:hypothetical protein n=1 Tax=Roseomonas sp. BN140053 TaxID=3391898 RepID=UPI0039EAB470